jgi:hypothetical protein
VRAHLISDNNGPVWQIDGENRDRHGRHAHPVPGAAGQSVSRPTLIWTLENEGARASRGGVVPGGRLAWNADYVLTVARDDKTADLDGWVTVKNGSGTSFRNATLQLVRGELNRVAGSMKMMRSEDVRTGRPRPPRRWRRNRSPTITSTRSAAGPRSTTPRRSRSAC